MWLEGTRGNATIGARSEFRARTCGTPALKTRRAAQELAFKPFGQKLQSWNTTAFLARRRRQSDRARDETEGAEIFDGS